MQVTLQTGAFGRTISEGQECRSELWNRTVEQEKSNPAKYPPKLNKNLCHCQSHSVCGDISTSTITSADFKELNNPLISFHSLSFLHFYCLKAPIGARFNEGSGSRQLRKTISVKCFLSAAARDKGCEIIYRLCAESSLDNMKS